MIDLKDALSKSDLRVWVNTLSLTPHEVAGHIDEKALLDPVPHWGRVIELGADIIQTDYPVLLRKYLDEKEL